MCEQQDIALIRANQCPVCQKKCGNKSPRHAMMSHIRRSADSAHVVWKAKNWHIHFAHGNFRPKSPSTCDLLKIIEQEYGTKMIHLITDELCRTGNRTV